jgi:trehalose 6-phosphate phosphatase
VASTGATAANHPAHLPAPPRLDLPNTSLFTDLDGTLAPIEQRPTLVGPDAARRRLLDDVAEALGGRLGVISGRTLADLDRILERRIAPIAAVHGLVRRSADGRVFQMPPYPGLARARDPLTAFAEADPGLLLEDKVQALALHYRRSPSATEAVLDLARRLAETCGLTIQRGDMVVELRGPGPNKGDALRAFMIEPPFAGATPVFLGDDFTDEDAFTAAQNLGGWGVIVGPRRPTNAVYALDDVGAARAWLAGALPKPRRS